MTEITGFDGRSTSLDQESETQRAVSDLQMLVAERVRKARELKGIPRRVLSEKSGVSQRYLAQMEAGDGNVSIGLLLRVARALDHRLEWFVGQEDPWTSDTLRAMELFRSADRNTKEAVLRLLNPEANTSKRANRVCLIGLRGAGKSTLGAKVATALDVPFLELNKEIETIGGMPVAEIMALYGQEGYRQLELIALDRVAEKHERVVLAAAGGVVAEPGTFNKLLANYNTVWIKATPREHMERVRAQGDERPMADNPEAMDQLKLILRSRETLYSRAQVELDTSGQTVESSVEALVKMIQVQKFLS